MSRSSLAGPAVLAIVLVTTATSTFAGDALVYIGGADGADNVYIVDPDGGETTRITANQRESGRRNEMSSLAAAPNGTRVACLFEAVVTAEIRTVALDGTGALTLPQQPGESSTAPAWSPDGARLALLRSTGMFDQQVHVVAADGSGIEAVTSSPEHKTSLAWSPDGATLAFLGATPVREESGGTSYNLGDLWVVAVSGGEPNRLTSGGGRVGTFAWSPDGRELAYTFSPQSPDQANLLLADELYVVPVQGGEPRKLTEKADSYDTDPCWSPDGAWIAFRSVRNGGSESIYVMRADGTEARRLTDDAWGSEQRLPRFSPDGTRIAYGEKDGWTLKLCVMAADGSDQRAIAEGVKEFVWTTRP